MRVIISAGGTGGHIYPAISIINKIKAEEPDSEFLYIGTDNRMESEIIPKLGIDFRGITIYGFKRKLTLDNFKTLHYFLKARRTCKGIIREFNPDIVIGCGGYVTAPVIWAGKKLGKKTFIHEQNSVVGLSNRYLTKYADRIGVCFESVMKEFPRDKVVLTGNPCSEEALRSKKASKKEFGLTEGKKLILIVMGSLGSGSISDMFISFLKDFGDKDYEVLFVSGKGQYDKFRDIVLPSNVKVVSFIENLPRVMKIADIMVTRAGASTISEIMAIDTVSIFIPSPYVTNNHQEMNAMDLVNKKAGRMIREADLNKETLFSEIDSLLNNRKEYEEIKRNLREYGIKDSGSRIYETLKDLMMSDKRFFRKHDIRCEENVNLKKCNTYRLDVMCDYMVFPNSYEKVAKVVKYCKEKGIRFMFLGNGSNVIFKCNRFAGVIIRLSEFNDIYVEDNIVIAGGGCSLVTLAARTISEGLTGLEFAGAIPGEVGASIAMNAGAYNEDMAGVLSKVLIVNDKNRIVVWEADGIDFSYRDSFFKGSKDFFVVAAEFTLKKGDKDKMHEVVKRRIIKRSETQPLEFPSAGSVFRNPEGLHAGKLIEDLGLKGFSIGGAKISEKHANFIINAGGATGEDIVNLIEFVRGKVKEKYDIDLILEQVIIE